MIDQVCIKVLSLLPNAAFFWTLFRDKTPYLSIC